MAYLNRRAAAWTSSTDLVCRACRVPGRLRVVSDETLVLSAVGPKFVP